MNYSIDNNPPNSRIISKLFKYIVAHISIIVNIATKKSLYPFIFNIYIITLSKTHVQEMLYSIKKAFEITQKMFVSIYMDLSDHKKRNIYLTTNKERNTKFFVLRSLFVF